MPRRLTAADEQKIIRAYQDWGPDDGSMDDLARAMGVAKQTLYNVLADNDVPLKSTGRAPRRSTRAGAVGAFPPELWEAMTERALDFLLEQVIDLREENAALRRRLARYEEVVDDG